MKGKILLVFLQRDGLKWSGQCQKAKECAKVLLVHWQKKCNELFVPIQKNRYGLFKRKVKGSRIILVIFRNQGTAYFYFSSKSRSFHFGLRKASKEHFTQVKAVWTLRRWKVRRFQENKNQPSVFWFVFWAMQKMNRTRSWDIKCYLFPIRTQLLGLIRFER